MILYHITEKKNIKSILKQGLKLGLDKRIYFSGDISSAKCWIEIIKTEYGLNKTPFKILKVDIDRFIITRLEPINKAIAEAVTLEPIRPEKIKEVI